MATIRAYTTTEQSRKLAKILPLDSADMYWDLLSKDKYAKVNNIGHCLGRTCVYAWSLAALLGVLPNYQLQTQDDGIGILCSCNGNFIIVTADNSVDACYELILKLHELNML